jgi:hypothetical protein
MKLKWTKLNLDTDSQLAVHSVGKDTYALYVTYQISFDCWQWAIYKEGNLLAASDMNAHLFRWTAKRACLKYFKKEILGGKK